MSKILLATLELKISSLFWRGREIFSLFYVYGSVHRKYIFSNCPRRCNHIQFICVCKLYILVVASSWTITEYIFSSQIIQTAFGAPFHSAGMAGLFLA